MAVEQNIEGFEEYAKEKQKATFFSRLTPTQVIIIGFIVLCFLFFVYKMGVSSTQIVIFSIIVMIFIYLFLLRVEQKKTQKIVPYPVRRSELNKLLEWEQAVGILPMGSVKQCKDFRRRRSGDKLSEDIIRVVLTKYPSGRRYNMLYTYDPNEDGFDVLGNNEFPGFPEQHEFADVKVPPHIRQLEKLLFKGKTTSLFNKMKPQGDEQQ